MNRLAHIVESEDGFEGSGLRHCVTREHFAPVLAHAEAHFNVSRNEYVALSKCLEYLVLAQPLAIHMRGRIPHNGRSALGRIPLMQQCVRVASPDTADLPSVIPHRIDQPDCLLIRLMVIRIGGVVYDFKAINFI